MTKKISRKANLLRAMVLDLASSDPSPIKRHIEILENYFKHVDREVDMSCPNSGKGEQSLARESEDAQENEAYAYHLTEVRAHRNSLVFQGGDFDLYLSLQNPGNRSSSGDGPSGSASGFGGLF